MKNTIKNLARAFKAKLFLGLFVFLFLFIPLFTFAQSNATINNSLPTEESFLEMWEERIKNDPETVIFEKIEEGRYHFKTSKFLFDDELLINNIDLSHNLEDCENGHSRAEIKFELAGMPEISDFRDERGHIKKQYLNKQDGNYYTWYTNNNFFYHDYKTERWLSAKEYSDKEGKCEKRNPLSYFPQEFILLFAIIFIVSVIIFYLIRNNCKRLKNFSEASEKRELSSDSIADKFIRIFKSEIIIEEESSEKATIIIPNTNWQASPFMVFQAIFMGMFFLIGCIVALTVNMYEYVVIQVEFLQNIFSLGKSGSIIVFIAYFIYLYCFLTIWVNLIRYLFLGSNKIYIDKTKNKVITYYGSIKLFVLPKIEIKKELDMNKTFIEIKNLSKIPGIVCNETKKLYLFSGKGFLSRMNGEIATNRTNEEKEKIYNVLKKYIKKKNNFIN